MTGNGSELQRLDDLRLAKEARRSREAAGQVIDRLLPRVRKAVGFLVGGDPEGQDLVGVCLEEVLKSLRRFRGEGSLESWADRVTYRVVMRQMKRRRRREKFVNLKPDMDVWRAPFPSQEASTHRLHARLEIHLANLPPERRNTLLLRVILGHSVAEVAELTETPVNTVRDRIRVALRELRESLSKDSIVKELISELANGND